MKVSFPTWLGEDGLKAKIVADKLALHYNDEGASYYLFSNNDSVIYETRILKDSGDDQVDFETNYKANCNKPILAEVLTQFEKNNISLKCVSAKATVGEDSWAEVLIKIPGTFSSLDQSSHGRMVVGGHAWFDEKHLEDRLVELEVVDIDDILGMGEGVVLKTYCDDEVGDLEGWYVPYHSGIVEITPMGGYGFIASELYLRIKAKKGGGIVTGTFYCNIKWGQLD